MSLKRLDEYGAAGVVEMTVAMNVGLFRTKFKASVLLPKSFSLEWSCVPGIDEVDIGELKVKVLICRQAVAVKDGVADVASNFLGTIKSLTAEARATMQCSVDSVSHSMKEGEDFWLNTLSKQEATKKLKSL